MPTKYRKTSEIGKFRKPTLNFRLRSIGTPNSCKADLLFQDCLHSPQSCPQTENTELRTTIRPLLTSNANVSSPDLPRNECVIIGDWRNGKCPCEPCWTSETYRPNHHVRSPSTVKCQNTRYLETTLSQCCPFS